LIDDAIFAEPNQIFQVRYPNVDIFVRTINLQTVNLN
jgi:hypothetical protein